MPPGLPISRLPAMRYHTVKGSGETLYGMAQEIYGNPRQFVDIYNANRTGIIRKDNTPGILDSIDAPLPVGALILLP
jgi:nucleoid-associated protein YgaU